MIAIEQHGRTALIRLSRGLTHAINAEMVQALGAALARVKNDAEIRGLVLAGSHEKFFSIGFDLPALIEWGREDFSHFFRRFNQVCLDLFTLPEPTVAAIRGHAVAGGCILALCCDYRLIAQGRKLVGLNEVKLGLPVPYLPNRVLQAVAGMRCAREMMESGAFYEPEQMLAMGVADAVLPSETVESTALEKAETLGALPAAGFAAIKQHRVESIAAEVQARQEDTERLFVDLWLSEAVRQKLRKAMETF